MYEILWFGNRTLPYLLLCNQHLVHNAVRCKHLTTDNQVKSSYSSKHFLRWETELVLTHSHHSSCFRSRESQRRPSWGLYRSDTAAHLEQDLRHPKTTTAPEGQRAASPSSQWHKLHCFNTKIAKSKRWTQNGLDIRGGTLRTSVCWSVLLHGSLESRILCFHGTHHITCYQQ